MGFSFWRTIFIGGTPRLAFWPIFPFSTSLFEELIRQLLHDIDTYLVAFEA